jgi:transposase
VKVPRNGRGRPKKRPLRLIGDKGYDSDPLRKRLKELKIDLIVPHRKNRKKPKLQDGRKLRRYRKRWKVERTFAWLGNYRRLLVRHEREIDMYRAFFHLACLIIVLNRF